MQPGGRGCLIWMQNHGECRAWSIGCRRQAEGGGHGAGEPHRGEELQVEMSIQQGPHHGESGGIPIHTTRGNRHQFVFSGPLSSAARAHSCNHQRKHPELGNAWAECARDTPHVFYFSELLQRYDHIKNPRESKLSCFQSRAEECTVNTGRAHTAQSKQTAHPLHRRGGKQWAIKRLKIVSWIIWHWETTYGWASILNSGIS